MVQISKLNQIKSDKNFNFVYVKSEIARDNIDQIKLLAEMISPLIIYTGLDQEQEKKISNEGRVFVYRKYKKQYI